MLKYILLIFVLHFAVLTYGQQKATDKPPAFMKDIPQLNIGDSLPNVTIQKILNGAKRTLQIADFRNQLLILDFWDTYCGSCIAAMPKMEKLQQIFGSKLSILLVTWQQEKMVSDFWKRNNYTRDIKLPSVVEDSLLHSYFRHRGVPHEVWIYKGRVIGITDGEHVDEKNIKAVLEGGTPSLPLKYDFYPAYDAAKPVFGLNSAQMGESSRIIRYAVISDYKRGVFSGGWSDDRGIFRDSVRKSVRVYFLNTPIWISYFILLRNIYKENNMVTPSIIGKSNNTVWEVSDRSKYRYNIYAKSSEQGYSQDWLMDHAICFEGLYPDKGQSDAQIYISAIKDMNRLLGLNVRWEKRREKVYVIRDRTYGQLIQKNKAVASFSINLNGLEANWNRHEDYPYLFDESVKANKGIEMDIDTTDMLNKIPVLKLQLAAYGLDLKEEERLVDKIVFSELNEGLLLDGKAQANALAEKEIQKGMAEPTAEQGKAFLEANKSKPGVVVLSSGLQYKVLKGGIGNTADSTSKVTVRYTGTLVNGKIFDSSALRGKSITIVVKDMIQGWKEALQLMPLGSRWIIYIPSELAYGTHTNMGQLPRSSALIFEMEVLRITK